MITSSNKGQKDGGGDNLNKTKPESHNTNLSSSTVINFQSGTVQIDFSGKHTSRRIG